MIKETLSDRVFQYYMKVLVIFIWHNGGSFQIMEEHISFERIQIIGENDYGS